MIASSQRENRREKVAGRSSEIMRSAFRNIVRPFEGTGVGALPGVRQLLRLLVRLLLPSDRIVIVDGHHVELHPVDEGVTAAIVLTGRYEEPETRFIRESVQPGMVVADVGANVGILSLSMARATEDSGRVYAFEPDAANLELLERNIQRNGYSERVVSVGKAVADHSGTATLFVSEVNRGEHTLVQGAVLPRTSVAVATVSMDDFFENIGVFPDFLKVDVQGAEVKVLRGMQRMLSRGFPRIILAEFWPKGLRCGQEAETAIDEILRGIGYTPQAITPMKCGYQNIAWTRN